MTTMSNHEEFAAALAGYAIDALDGAERLALEAHLPTCAQCQAELAELRRVAAALGGAVVAVPPPPALKAKVLAQATAQKQAPQTPQAGAPSRFLRRPAASPPPPAPTTSTAPTTPGRLVRVRVRRSRSPLPIAASIVIALGLGGYAWLLRSEVDSLRLQLTQMSINAENLRKELTTVRSEAARFRHTAGVLAAPVLLKASLTGDPTRMPGATGRAFLSAERGVFFRAEHMQALPDGQAYQLWLIPSGGAKPVPFPQTYRPDATGAFSANTPMPLASSVFQIAVTIEPIAGSSSPTTPVVLSGAVTPG